MNQCFFCKADLKSESHDYDPFVIKVCPICGTYVLSESFLVKGRFVDKEKIKKKLCEQKNKIHFFGSKDSFLKYLEKNPDSTAIVYEN